MYNIVKYRRYFYLISAIVILPGLISMIISLFSFGAPFRLSIDFTGGSLWELRFDQSIPPGDLVQLALGKRRQRRQRHHHRR